MCDLHGLHINFRGCTGFDGNLEISEAIRGRDHVKTLTLNLNADEKLALAA